MKERGGSSDRPLSEDMTSLFPAEKALKKRIVVPLLGQELLIRGKKEIVIEQELIQGISISRMQDENETTRDYDSMKKA